MMIGTHGMKVTMIALIAYFVPYLTEDERDDFVKYREEICDLAVSLCV